MMTLCKYAFCKNPTTGNSSELFGVRGWRCSVWSPCLSSLRPGFHQQVWGLPETLGWGVGCQLQEGVLVVRKQLAHTADRGLES